MNDGDSDTQSTAGQQAGPCAMVLFGAGGDLTKRKLMPAIYNLAKSKLLPEQFAIIGVSIEQYSIDEFRKLMTEDIGQYSGENVDAKSREWFAKRIYYVSGDFKDAGLYRKLAEVLGQAEQEQRTEGNCLFYMATSPVFFSVVAEQLGAAGLTKEEAGKWRRVVIEKPFGHDLPSAVALNHALRSVLEEKQIYRMDHYLGKETVQNILAFRFANGIFEPVWNRRYVDHVQVTVAEELGVELRGGYYDTAGALRDMVPNHIFQLITLSAMEPPISFDAEAVHDEQTKVLRAIQPLTPERVLDHAVRGQYGEGTIDGKHVPAYRERAPCSARFANAYFCRHGAADRQLALGRRAVLSSHRQAPGRALHAGRHSLPPPALRAVPQDFGGDDRPQRIGHQYPAGRRHLVEL